MYQLLLPPKPYFALSSYKTKKDTPSSIYYTIRIGESRLKTPLGVKVIRSQWSQKEQIAIVSNVYSKIDNFNNGIVNEKIGEVKRRYTEVLDEIALELSKIDLEFKNKKDIFAHVGEMLRNAFKMKKKNNYRQILNELKCAIENDKISDGTKVNYRKGCTALEAYFVANGIEEFSFKEFTTEFFIRLINWMDINYLMPNGLPYARRTINDYENWLVMLLENMVSKMVILHLRRASV